RVESGHFSWLLLLTPGIPPSALRAGCAVRHRSCGGVGQQREVTRAPKASETALLFDDRSITLPQATSRQCQTLTKPVMMIAFVKSIRNAPTTGATRNARGAGP